MCDSKFSTVICAPVYTKYLGLSTQVFIDVDDGLKHASSIHCDELVSLSKSMLTDYVGTLSITKTSELNHAMRIALNIENT
jgi:mRNA interferase MazF